MRDSSREILRFCLCFCSLPASCPELVVCLQMMSSWLKFLISLLARALGISSSIDICIMHTGFMSYHSASYFNYLNLTVNESGSQERWYWRNKIGFRNSISEWDYRTILTPPPSPPPPPPTSPLRPVHCRGNCCPGVSGLLPTRWPSEVERQNFLAQQCSAGELQTSTNCRSIALLSTDKGCLTLFRDVWHTFVQLFLTPLRMLLWVIE